MRLSPIAILLCLAVFLIDATPVFTSIPTVIVYPLAASSATLDREASARISTTLATQIAAGGDIKVVPPKIDIDRAHYLSEARAAGATYYVTGFITPLGSGASVIEQVVSTTSGALVFSVSNYISSYAEVVGQGDQLREGILARQQRAIAAFAAPPAPATTPEPEPSKGTDVNVSGIFNHKKKGPLPVAALPPPDVTIAVLAVGGSADSDARDAAAQAITEAFVHAGRHAVIATAFAPSPDICAANKATVQIASWLDAPGATPARADAALRLIAYDCDGVIAYDHTTLQKGPGATAAATSAAGAAVAAYLAPARRS